MEQEYQDAYRRFSRDPGQEARKEGASSAQGRHDPFGPDVGTGGPKAYRAPRQTKPFQRAQGLYAVLGVAVSASGSEIKKAFMVSARLVGLV